MQSPQSRLSCYALSILGVCVSFFFYIGNAFADDQLLARLNGQAISKEMLTVLSTSRQQGPLSDLEQNQDELLDNLITTELLFTQAKKLKLDSNKAIAMELELAYKTLLSQFYVKQYMDQLVFDEATLKAAYAAQAPQAMVRMAYWAFDTESEARLFLDAMKTRQGAVFTPGEELPWQALENYPFAQLPEAKTLAEGQWLSIATRDEIGWLVWRCLERSAIPKPPFEDAKESLKQELASLRLQEHIADLRAKASIEYFSARP